MAAPEVGDSWNRLILSWRQLMTHGNRIAGVALATAAAALFIAGTGVSTADTTTPSVVKSKCYGGNACKGQSECKTTTNACKGQNACKGEGFTLYNVCDRHGRS
jgi:uncharacterized membrane protein